MQQAYDQLQRALCTLVNRAVLKDPRTIAYKVVVNLLRITKSSCVALVSDTKNVQVLLDFEKFRRELLVFLYKSYEN